MIELLVWSVVSFAVIMAATALYVVSQAYVGLLFGVRVKQVAIGYDISGVHLLRWRGRQWEWIIGVLPLGGYTKFVGVDDEEPNQTDVEEVGDVQKESARKSVIAPPPGSFPAASVAARNTILLVGPFSQILVGVLLLAIPVAMATGQARLTMPNASTIRPCAVSGLSVEPFPSTLQGQGQLCGDIGFSLFRKICLFQPLDNWGGFIGCVLTCGAAAIHSLPLWLSCMGVVAMLLGVLNLLPIPPLNGGTIAMNVLETITGKPLPVGLQGAFTIFGVILVMIWYARMLVADVLWLIVWTT